MILLGSESGQHFVITFFIPSALAQKVLEKIVLLWKNCLSVDTALVTILRFFSFLKNWANPGLFFIYFRLFKHTPQFLQQINLKKCPPSLWCWESNSQPLKHESPPITIRPGLPLRFFSFKKIFQSFLSIRLTLTDAISF